MQPRCLTSDPAVYSSLHLAIDPSFEQDWVHEPLTPLLSLARDILLPHSFLRALGLSPHGPTFVSSHNGPRYNR